jgi:hypothetical protein
VNACVGISVSEPGTAELEARGLSHAHVHHAFVEIARQILAAGGSLAYGGDLRAGGYTASLLSLLRTYSDPDRPATERIRLYFGAPAWRKLRAADFAELRTLSTPIKVAAAGRGSAPAADFTAMRERMTAETDARVVVGGLLAGYVGAQPGVVEEAELALRAGKPLLVAGGLGGAAARVADSLRERPATDLRNGLDAEENAVLFATADLDLIVALILRGLERRFGAR